MDARKNSAVEQDFRPGVDHKGSERRKDGRPQVRAKSVGPSKNFVSTILNEVVTVCLLISSGLA